ncbi:hypothetical protein PALB_22780 [Pseudoalteromonas luteoviolacea B = ATCC 29581]|nr:hypothetical protein PALB_22780 [Pseudoalteromonas luteoviolacea B = ATCC 29581]
MKANKLNVIYQAITLLMATTLVGCGQSGALYLPEQEKANQQTPTAAQSQVADTKKDN